RALARCGRAARERAVQSCRVKKPEPDQPARAKRAEESEQARASTTPRNTRPRTRGWIRCSLRRASDVEVEGEEHDDDDRPHDVLVGIALAAAVVRFAIAAVRVKTV